MYQEYKELRGRAKIDTLFLIILPEIDKKDATLKGGYMNCHKIVDVKTVFTKSN